MYGTQLHAFNKSLLSEIEWRPWSPERQAELVWSGLREEVEEEEVECCWDSRLQNGRRGALS